MRPCIICIHFRRDVESGYESCINEERPDDLPLPHYLDKCEYQTTTDDVKMVRQEVTRTEREDW